MSQIQNSPISVEKGAQGIARDNGENRQALSQPSGFDQYFVPRNQDSSWPASNNSNEEYYDAITARYQKLQAVIQEYMANN